MNFLIICEYESGRDRSGGAEVRLAHVSVQHFGLLRALEKRSGGEGDHSRGHWPLEAYAHLVIGARLLEEYGYGHTVYADPDAWIRDDALRYEVPLVEGIGCIAAIPAACLAAGAAASGALGPRLARGGVPARDVAKVLKMARERNDEYRLVTDAANLAAVTAAAAAAGRGYEVTNGTNSGVVVYNNRFLRDSAWADWLHALANVSSKGWYGDQTGLSVALGRSDVPVRCSVGINHRSTAGPGYLRTPLSRPNRTRFP